MRRVLGVRLSYFESLAGGGVLNDLRSAAGPDYLDFLDHVTVAKSEFQFDAVH